MHASECLFYYYTYFTDISDLYDIQINLIHINEFKYTIEHHCKGIKEVLKWICHGP